MEEGRNGPPLPSSTLRPVGDDPIKKDVVDGANHPMIGNLSTQVSALELAGLDSAEATSTSPAVSGVATMNPRLNLDGFMTDSDDEKNDEPSLPLPAVANGDQQAPTGTSIQEGLASAMVTASEPSGGSKSASGGDGWSLSDSDFRDPEIVQLENTIACDPSPPPLPRPGVDAAPARSAHDDWIHLDPSLPSFKMPYVCLI